MVDAMRRHWPEYLIEGALLGLFMISACAFATLLEYPGSPVHQAIADPFIRRILMGTAMGLTAIALIFSPWGKQSGAHINPAITVTFFRLGKIASWDAFFYIVAQFVGAMTGVLLMAVIGHTLVAHPAVNYVATVPGVDGPTTAVIAEFIISFMLMLVVLISSNTQKLARYTGLFAGALVATYIIVEAPLSGMSMNPARSLGSAVPPRLWEFLWIYFTAPPLGMLLAAEVYLRLRGAHRVICAKLHHHNDKRCIFLRCGYKMHQGEIPH